MHNYAEQAVRMAVSMQSQMSELRSTWKKRGFDLGLGIGIGEGYATLGIIGFEGRWGLCCHWQRHQFIG